MFEFIPHQKTWRAALELWIVLMLLLCFWVPVQAQDKPNFVWLISEDNSIHYLNQYDSQGAETPRIRALAQEGLLFENAFSCSPVCSVARTTLMTACYAPRIGAQFHRKSVPVPMPRGLHMFPFYLREAGYYTSNNQKKDYNVIEEAGVWDASSRKANWRDRSPGQPFFHMQSFPVSHEGTLHFSRDDMEQTPTQTDPASIKLAPIYPDTPTFRYTHARYLDGISRMDAQIGGVLDQLAEDGLMEETFIFYFGDHGGVLPGSKGYAYDRGLHVPLMVRVPEKWRHLVHFKPGSRLEGFVSFVDFGPTLLELAGLTVPHGVDGTPFLGPEIKPDDLAKRQTAFGYADRFDEKYDFVRTLRWGKYEYVRSFIPFNFDGLHNNYRYNMLAYREWRDLFNQGELNSVQSAFFQSRPAEALYDIHSDPYETHNLADQPGHSETLIRMRQMLQKKMINLPDLSFYPESFLVEHAFDNPIEFGALNQNEISELSNMADLQLVPFAKAKPDLLKHLNSEKSIFRYWALIHCTTHAVPDPELVKMATDLSETDPDLLVRTRAAEFLAWVKVADPQPIIMNALGQTTSGEEAALILNTVVLLRDGRTKIPFKIAIHDLNPAVRKDSSVQRRMTYLNQN